MFVLAEPRSGASTLRGVPGVHRYRCSACGNLTRFDVTATRRTRAFHHYNLAGDLEVEDEELLDETIEQIACRWCGASGDVIEVIDVDTADDVSA